MDSATGLLYVGGGQYYDPQTGRFLNRNANPDQSNPYVPWKGNPSGALISPLAILALVYGRKKKRGKFDTLVIVLVLCVAVGMSLSACTPSTFETPSATVAIVTEPASNGTTKATATVTPKLATATDTPMPTVTQCTATLIPTLSTQI